MSSSLWGRTDRAGDRRVGRWSNGTGFEREGGSERWVDGRLIRRESREFLKCSE